jgi:nitrate reductase (cytochrome), electron transfer subunit
MNLPPDTTRSPRRHAVHWAVVAGVIALTVGLSGFFMGLRQTRYETAQRREAWRTPPPEASVASAEVQTALAYRELATGPLLANRTWENHLASLASPAPERASFALLPSDQQQILRLHRASRRQYDGAPPVAPHPLDQMSAATCLECHGKSTIISGVAVPRMSHEPYQNCLQCHVSSAGPTSTWRTRPVSLAAGNGFTGKPAPGYGARAYPGAPPVMPHTTWMRQSCITCHGPGGTTAFRTSHPERQNCVQCHAGNALFDQSPRFAAAGANSTRPPPLPSSPLPPPLPEAR